MKKIYCLLLLVLTLPVLGCAQEMMFPEEPAYIMMTMPFTYDAELRDDAGQLYEAMTAELAWQGSQNNQFSIEKSQMGLTGAPPPSEYNLSPGDLAKNPRYVITGNVFLDQGDKVLEIYLWLLEDSSLKASQELAYGDISEALGFIPFFMWSLTSTLPLELVPFTGEQEDIRWKNKWLYVGLQAGPSVRFYFPFEESPMSAALTFDIGLRLEAQLLTFIRPKNFFSLSLMTGAHFGLDMAAYDNYSVILPPQGGVPGEDGRPQTNNDPVNFSYLSLYMPLMFKFNIKPGPFVLSPYGGVYFHTSFGASWTGDLINDLPLGYVAGFTAGRKTGPGILFLDVRWAGDMDKTQVSDEKGSVNFFRNMLTLSVGYEFGFIDHKIKEEPVEEDDKTQ
jgi:hypothetical protein